MLQIRPAAVDGFTAREVGKSVLDHDGRRVADVVDVRGGRLYVDAATVDAVDAATTDAGQAAANGHFDGTGPHRLPSEAVGRVTDDAVHLAD